MLRRIIQCILEQIEHFAAIVEARQAVAVGQPLGLGHALFQFGDLAQPNAH